MIYIANMDDSKYNELDIRPSHVVDGKEIKYPCVLYTSVYDHTGRPLAIVEVSRKNIDSMNEHCIKITRAISLIGANAMRSARLHEEVRRNSTKAYENLRKPLHCSNSSLHSSPPR